MRIFSTGALVVCVIGMVVCRWFEQEYPVLAWARAFFEAATVGALADWFAVVALFRHPMGIPIPHTAILPNNKGRVADSLATFLETSFLTEEQLGPRFRKIDCAAFLSEWLETNAPMVAEKAVQFAPKVVGGLLHGDCDERASWQGAENTARDIQTSGGDAQLEIIEGATHFLLLSHRAELGSWLRKIL